MLGDRGIEPRTLSTSGQWSNHWTTQIVVDVGWLQSRGVVLFWRLSVVSSPVVRCSSFVDVLALTDRKFIFEEINKSTRKHGKLSKKIITPIFGPFLVIWSEEAIYLRLLSEKRGHLNFGLQRKLKTRHQLQTQDIKMVLANAPSDGDRSNIT